MSGIEVVGLISSIIAIIDASAKVYHAFASCRHLSPTIHRAAARLPLVKDTLNSAITNFAEEEQDSLARLGLDAILDSCRQKATKLEAIFATVTSSKRSSSWKRLRQNLGAAVDQKVDLLMNGILADLQVLAANQTMKTATWNQVQGLREDVVATQVATSPDVKTHVYFINEGSGIQALHTQAGNANFNVGSGPQVYLQGADRSTFYF